ncbi:MAG: hypothetical protein NTX03_10580 [Bacteroidetes bacterium]|nr:hypothetical protein [Bacteroidota bacterium]
MKLFLGLIDHTFRMELDSGDGYKWKFNFLLDSFNLLFPTNIPFTVFKNLNKDSVIIPYDTAIGRYFSDSFFRTKLINHTQYANVFQMQRYLCKNCKLWGMFYFSFKEGLIGFYNKEDSSFYYKQ